MALQRVIAGAALAALVAGPAMAQIGGATGGATGGTMSQGVSPTGTGAMQSPSTGSQPYAPPPLTGGAAQPSAAATTGGSMAQGGVSSFTPIQAMPGANIVAELQASGEFTTLLKALAASNLTGLISTHANLTLFAPTDAAFAALPPGQLDMLMKSPAQLQAILTYHLVATTIRESEVKGHAAGQVMTAARKNVTIDGSGPVIKVNDASVLQSAVPASNGEIYPIDKVLTPPAA